MNINYDCEVCTLVSHAEFVYTMETLKYAEENVSEDKTLIHKL